MSLTHHSDSGSFLVAQTLLSQDGCQWEGFWKVERTYGLVSPFDFSEILQIGCGLLVLCPLPGMHACSVTSVISDSLRPMDCSPPGSSVHEILQVRILEWVAISSSRESSWPRDGTHVSCTAGGFFSAEPPGKPSLPGHCRKITHASGS